jgi:hypothetical protein
MPELRPVAEQPADRAAVKTHVGSSSARGARQVGNRSRRPELPAQRSARSRSAGFGSANAPFSGGPGSTRCIAQQAIARASAGTATRLRACASRVPRRNTGRKPSQTRPPPPFSCQEVAAATQLASLGALRAIPFEGQQHRHEDRTRLAKDRAWLRKPCNPHRRPAAAGRRYERLDDRRVEPRVSKKAFGASTSKPRGTNKKLAARHTDRMIELISKIRSCTERFSLMGFSLPRWA